MSRLQFCGIGDLHLDGRISKFIPEANSYILSECQKVANHARRNGIGLLVYYGDICDTPVLSAEGLSLLLDYFVLNQDLKHILILGNHDFESTEKHSLQLLMKIISLGFLSNVKVIEKPTTLYRKQGTPLRLLPWPHFTVEKDCLNVIHVETAGSKWDMGRVIDSEHKTSAHCLGGHLHTHQVIGKKENIHYSGTLYQTSFGEKYEKYFHQVEWDGVKPIVESIPNKAKYELVNYPVHNLQDLTKIEVNPFKLYKVFVNSGLELDASTFDHIPNVVRINSFKTKAELNNLISEELMLADSSTEVTQFTVMEALESFIDKSSADKSVVDRAKTLANSLLIK